MDASGLIGILGLTVGIAALFVFFAARLMETDFSRGERETRRLQRRGRITREEADARLAALLEATPPN